MELNTYFSDFLAEIRLPEEYADECRRAHETLRQQLEDDTRLSPLVVSTFLQGSYRRGTIIRPNTKEKADVDVVLVSKIHKEQYTPDQAFAVFVPFLEKYYKGKYKFQGRSIGIELDHVDLDLVITAAPSESEIGILESASVKYNGTLAELNDWVLNKNWDPSPLGTKNNNNEEWKAEPLLIPDRERKIWERTHPLEQIQWTRDKNKRCNGHYINVVKAIKWWYRSQKNTSKYPKGYLIEHLVGFYCPNGIQSVSEGITKTLEAITISCKNIAEKGQVPNFPDHGVPEHNVFARITPQEFSDFYSKISEAAKVAIEAFESQELTSSANKWRYLFGEDFPEPPPSDNSGGNGPKNGGDGPKKGGFTPRSDPSIIGGGRFAQWS